MLRYKSEGRKRQCRNPKARSLSEYDALRQEENDKKLEKEEKCKKIQIKNIIKILYKYIKRACEPVACVGHFFLLGIQQLSILTTTIVATVIAVIPFVNKLVIDYYYSYYLY